MRRQGSAFAILIAPLLAQAEPQGAAKRPLPPVQVFILAGQSNMEGYGAISELGDDRAQRPGTLTRLTQDPATAPAFKHLLDPRPAPAASKVSILAANSNFGDPAPGVRKQLEVVWTIQGKRGQQSVGENETLTIEAPPDRVAIESARYGDFAGGPAVDVTAIVRMLATDEQKGPRWLVRDDVWVQFLERSGPLGPGFGAHPQLFGIELQCGQTLGNAIAAPVVIVKAAWGGRSLHTDFRPPSAGGEVGAHYRLLLATVAKALADLPGLAPELAGRGHELAGLIWWHGWNDGCDPDRAVPEYEQNLVHLIHDLRRDLGAPRLPVVIAELTGPWVAPVEPQWIGIRRAQAAAAAHADFAGNVRFVPTHDFVRREEDSPGGWACHEFNNAETYVLVGKACGEAMLALCGVAAK